MIDISSRRLTEAVGKTGTWTRRLGLFYLVVTALIGLAALFSFGTISTLALASLGGDGGLLAGGGMALVGLLMVVYIGVYGYLSYLFYRAGDVLKVRPGNVVTNARLEAGFGYLATFFKVAVLLIAVVIGLGAVATLVAGLVA